MTNSSQAGQELAEKYLSLLKQRDQVNDQIEQVKKQISEYCEANKTKKIQAGNKLIRVSQKFKTVFPRKGTQGRKIVEDIMRDSKEWQEAITFDVVKLGLVYDKNKLSSKLMDKLEPYVSKQEAIRLYVSSLKKKKHVKKD